MASRSDRPIVTRRIEDEPEGPLFFTDHEWATVEAATARIYPSDHQPGAREAEAVRFIDRYLSGLDYIFASADGSGFLAISGRSADAWRARIANLQRKYRAGIKRTDEIARSEFRRDFVALGGAAQDRVLEILLGAPKPTGIRMAGHDEAHVQHISDEGLPFFEALVLHTRQGVFCDPVYGGNKDRVGWEMLGFPGPKNLTATQDCTYGHKDQFLTDYDWPDLIPHLRENRRR
jgi:gluconate 2-dehydrogenase gamma chain